jgi:Bacteriophage tail sheath protein
MGTYLSPGVYVEEVSGGVKPIAGVGTSTGAFVGIAEKGVVGKAIPVTNWSQFVQEFGSFTPNGYLAYGVFGFFAEGGTTCYVVRAAKDEKGASVTIHDDGGADAVTVHAHSVGDYGDRSNGTWGNNISVVIEDSSDAVAANFKLTVKYKGQDVEKFDNISTAGKAAGDDLNLASSFIRVVVATAAKRPKNNIPASPAYTLSGGDDGVSGADYISDADGKKGIHAFDEVDDINIVAIPDIAGNRADILSALNYCKNRKDCFFIADPPEKLSISAIRDFKAGTGSYSGNAFNNSYGALYYPWVLIKDPTTGEKKPVPPSGVVAGTYAYTDSSRGVHKAPAGITDGYLDSVIGIERIVTKGEHDILNPDKINVIRSLSSGICLWGARTLSADSEWLYINIRRLLLFIEESVDEGSQWVVFEPNDPMLWGKVKRNITAFLTRVWRDGALFGTTPDEAFFVKVDAENNPPEVRDAGQLIIEVGVAPVKPAEFVIIRISQKTLTK